MGGAPSTVQNNDELVEYLLQNHYVRSKEVEIVFRAVDRADYVLPSHQESAYNDLAWKHGNLHLSAPCVYAVAMEFLSLKPGQSFLNIGSGTGYFSTMAGLLLGPYGVNHGIELHEECIHYARDRLDNFKQKSQTIEEFEFCEPYFVRGNCLRVIPTREYDTVYCGAAVTENNIAAVKRFVRIGGSIVMPYKGRLCCFKRFAETGWRCKKLLGVSFATLVNPDVAEQSSTILPESEPLSLQELCRSEVRQILRKNIWTEHPELEKRNLSLPYRQPRSDSLFAQSDEEGSNNDEDDDDDEDEEDEDEEEEEDDEEDDETDGHIIRRTRFLFNMEVDSNEPAGNPLLLSQRVAMLVRQRIGAQQQRAEALLGRISEEVRNDVPTTAGGASSGPVQENQSMDTSSNLVTDFWGNGQGDSNASQNPASERKTRESESGRDSEYDSDDDRLTQWSKIPKRDNTDSGIVDDVNVPYDDTSSSLNVGHSDSGESEAEDSDDMDVDLSSVALRETFRQVCEGRAKNLAPFGQPPSDDTAIIESAESRLFVNRMREKIQLLPLPTKLKIYMNHNRNLLT